MTKMQIRREELEMSREELAVKTGMAVTYRGVYRLENDGQIPRADLAVKIAKALKTTTEKLWATTEKGKG